MGPWGEFLPLGLAGNHPTYLKFRYGFDISLRLDQTSLKDILAKINLKMSVWEKNLIT